MPLDNTGNLYYNVVNYSISVIKKGVDNLLGAKIKSYLSSNGLKIGVIAQKCGIPFNVFSAMLNDSRKIKAEEYFVICKVLGVPLQLDEQEQVIDELEESNKLLNSNLTYMQEQVTTLSQSRGELMAVNASLEKQLQNKINLAYAQGLVDSGSTSDVVPLLIGVITLLEGVALVILIVSKIKNRKK